MSKILVAMTSMLSLALIAGTAAAASKTTAQKQPQVAQVQSPISKSCSDEANAKNLHGKARKAFRHKCMKEHTAKTRHTNANTMAKQ